jgi:hypothetical protein
MKWRVDVVGKPNQSIVVEYEPLNNNRVTISGRYKEKNKEWVTIYFDFFDAQFIERVIEEKLLLTYDNMKIRIDQFNVIDEMFKKIKLIEVNDPNNDDTSDESPYLMVTQKD